MSSSPLSSQNFNNDPAPKKTPSESNSKNGDPKSILKKVIEKELGKKVPIKNWSTQIENDLIAGVVASFEQHFPKHPLCKTTLRGLFSRLKEGLVKSEQKPFSLDQFLSTHLHLVIPQEYQQQPFTLSLALAEQLKQAWPDQDIAKLSTKELSAPIWSVQKHLLSDIKKRELRAPFEVWDYTDELVIDYLLSFLIANPLISHNDLVCKVEAEIKQTRLLLTLNENKQIRELLYSLYAQECDNTKIYDHHFSKFDKKNLNLFFSYFTALESKSDQTIIRAEWVERLLSLYILGSHLTKNLPDFLIESTIDLSINQLEGEKTDYNTTINRDLLIFFNACLYLRCFFAKGLSKASIKTFLLNCYELTHKLTSFHHKHFDFLEFFIHSKLEKVNPKLGSVDQSSKEYLMKILIKVQMENPYFSPTSHISKAIEICNQRLKLASTTKTNSKAQIKLKTHMWASSREMVARHIHIHSNHPFMIAISDEWKKEAGYKVLESVDHEKLIDKALTHVINEMPHLSHLQPHVRETLSTYYLVSWYDINFAPGTPTLDRWLFWQNQLLNNTDDLKKLCKLLFPNIPHDECLARFEALIKQKSA